MNICYSFEIYFVIVCHCAASTKLRTASGNVDFSDNKNDSNKKVTLYAKPGMGTFFPPRAIFIPSFAGHTKLFT